MNGRPPSAPLGGMKRHLARKRQALVKSSPLRKLSLIVVKKRSMRNALSSLPRVASMPEEFGFIPRDVDIQVLSWPKL